MDLWTTLWIVWGALFVVIEGAALARSQSGTLSETIWRWVGVRRGASQPSTWTWKRWALLAGLVWLLVHLAFGWLSL